MIKRSVSSLIISQQCRIGRETDHSNKQLIPSTSAMLLSFMPANEIVQVDSTLLSGMELIIAISSINGIRQLEQ